jgi:hypothetical protein
MPDSERQARTPKLMRFLPTILTATSRLPILSASHHSAARWPAPSGQGRVDRHQGPAGADKVDIGRDDRSPRTHPNRPPRTSGAVDIAMADLRTSRRLPSPEPCRDQHPSGQGRKVTQRLPLEVAGEVGRAGAGRPDSGPTALPSPVDCRVVRGRGPGTKLEPTEPPNRPLGT